MFPHQQQQKAYLSPGTSVISSIYIYSFFNNRNATFLHHREAKYDPHLRTGYYVFISTKRMFPLQQQEDYIVSPAGEAAYQVCSASKTGTYNLPHHEVCVLTNNRTESLTFNRTNIFPHQLPSTVSRHHEVCLPTNINKCVFLTTVILPGQQPYLSSPETRTFPHGQ